MLETIVASHPEAEVHYVHGARDANSHAMGAHIHNLVAAHPRAQNTVFYEAPSNDAEAYGSAHTGMISGQWLANQTPVSDADYYLCGPRPFLRTLVAELKAAGVTSDRIHYEFFGPADEVLAA
ncbi:hypothetical protein WEU32_14790 (plasmid) [Brevundimonas sp. BH3]|uniref:hypothetical protein n=1 Tax=Brevundimonas sp. BH3 TaxID=3133089 RepID=UPI003245897C